MAGFEEIDEAAKAGARAENADFHTSAAINPLKTAKRAFYIPCHFGQISVNGSVTDSLSGDFLGKLLPNAAASYMLVPVFAPRGEVSPGESAILHIYWTSAGTSGNVRFVVDVRPVIEGSANLSSAIQRAIISAADASGNEFVDAKINIPPAILSNNQLLSVKIARDPDNSLDTLGSDIVVRAVYLEIQGRC